VTKFYNESSLSFLSRLCCFFLVFIACVSHQADAEETQLMALLEKISANEVLYKNLEYRKKKEMLCVLPDYITKGPKGKNLFKKLERISHNVFQNELYSFQESVSGLSFTGQKSVFRIRSTYDGTLSRQVENSDVRLIPRKEPLPRMYRPHMFILGKHARGKSLAEYLSCGKSGGYFLNVIYEGEEVVQELDCHRIRVESWVKGQKTRDYWLMWLAPERNYIPVRGVGYAIGYSESIPLEIVNVTDWKELAPDVWFPFQVKNVVNFETAASKGETVVGNITKIKLTDVSLAPRYSLDFFQNIEVPPRSNVKDLREGNDKKRK